MGTADRHRLIGELLRTREAVTVDELMAECGASGATIRRDLEILAANGVWSPASSPSADPWLKPTCGHCVLIRPSSRRARSTSKTDSLPTTSMMRQ
ncbi:DeoR family transcriptional regulator [Paenarthrobacter ureafaciens]|uniref:DeoR family transcriptional regulator n=1 Tax=Paenarthrobacter ureafaciens TaxID=37931 RepID=UPI004045DD18